MKAKLAASWPWPLRERTQPLSLETTTVTGSSITLTSSHGFFVGLNQSAARICKNFGVGLDFFDHEAASALVGLPRISSSLPCSSRRLLELLFDLDGFQPGELAQANFQNVFGLALAEFEALDQRGLGLFGCGG